MYGQRKFATEDIRQRIRKKLEGGLYLDHASTSWPKAPGVGAAVTQTLEFAGSPTRGAHSLAAAGSDVVEGVRRQVAELVGTADPARVIFTPGATYALNLAIRGLGLGSEDHVVATCFDHNAVLRPLTLLRNERGVAVTTVQCNAMDGRLIDQVRVAIRPHTRLMTINCASNVTGAILPCAELIELAHAREIVVLLDACQTIGHLPVNLETLPADLIAFCGHKALLGPPGIGCLVIGNPELRVMPYVTGGTGHDSSNLAPEVAYPSSLEPGTLNAPAIAGLGAALEFLQQPDQRSLSATLRTMRLDCLNQLGSLPRVRIHSQAENSVPIISFNVEGLLPERVSATLNADYGIQTRAGLHCAPAAHAALQTGPYGSVRASFGFGNRLEANGRLLQAIQEMTA